MATCDKYKVDMAADVFGMCICGAAKNEHSKEALEKSAKKKRKKKKKKKQKKKTQTIQQVS